MKKLPVILFLLLAGATSFAQPAAKAPSADAAFAEMLNKVVLAFPGNFNAVQGARIPTDVDADSYKSSVCLPGALVCKVMRYHSVEDKSANWQAVLFAGESFDEAQKAYKKIFGQVKKSAIKGIATAPVSFDGKLDAIDESVGFAVSSLRLKTTNPSYKNMVAEVEISGSFSGWEVHLNIYTKKLIAASSESE